MRKLERKSREVRDAFRGELAKAFKEKFEVEVISNFDFLGCNRLVTTRVDGRRMTKAQREFIGAFDNGYFRAQEQIRKE